MIVLPKPRNKDVTPLLLIKEKLRLGVEHIKVAETSKYKKDRHVNDQIASMIRNCNGVLGMGGNFKNGCLYREHGLEPIWNKASEKVICDHAVPVTELVKQYRSHVSAEELIFSPVVRIKAASNERLTRDEKLAKEWKPEWRGFPFSRYAAMQDPISIVTHLGDEINTKELRKWSDSDHWHLVFRTEELAELLDALKISPKMLLNAV